MNSARIDGFPVWCMLLIVALGGVVAYSVMRPPTESEARAALVVTYPEFADKPIWFDGRTPTEEGFVCDLSKREWKYCTWSRDSFSPRYSGQFEWHTPGGWQTCNIWWWSQCTRRASDYAPRVVVSTDNSDIIPAHREVLE